MSKYSTKKNDSEEMPFELNEKVNYDFTVSGCKVIKEGRVKFNITVNGVTIYGMNLIEYKNKEGQEGTMISFPQWKGDKGYNNYCFFPISKENKEKIISQIDAALNA